MTDCIRRCRPLGIGAGVLAVYLLWIGSVQAQDGVKLSGHWVEPVTVFGIADGEVRYQIVSGRVLSRSTQTLEGIKLGRYPALGQAERAAEAGESVAAAELFREVFETGDPDWVRWMAGKRLIDLYTLLDDADAAADIYIDMLVTGAELSLVARPPSVLVARADIAVRRRVAQLATAAKGTVHGDRAALLDQLIDAAGGAVEAVSDQIESQDRLAPTEYDANTQGLTLTTASPPSTAGNLFRRGQYQQALSVVEEALSQPGKTASELYLKGMTQLALAEQSGGAGDYKSAGLSFMRVVVYFPRSAVAGAAMLEAGYVHEKIGRMDIASRLYQRARPLLDPREDPEYHERLLRRIESSAETQ